MHALLEPFVRELGDVREELGRERERREAAERRITDLERELLEVRRGRPVKGEEKAQNSAPLSESKDDRSTDAPGDAHEAAEPRSDAAGPQTAAQGAERRSWWRRLIGG